MCGRFVRHTNVQTLARLLDTLNTIELPESYNIAPSMPVLAARNDREGNREMAALRWGLIPYWAKDPAIAYRTINARAETVDAKPTFREPFKHRRCLIPADGFYEWQKTPNGKQPYYIALESGEPMFFAGLWDRYRHGEEPVESCSIITCAASDTLKSLHDRMPVLIEPEGFRSWLDPDTPGDELKAMLRVSDQAFDAYPVSKTVNKPANDMPDCILRLDRG